MSINLFSISTISSLLAATTLLTLVLGYGRALFDRHGAVFHLVVSIILVYGSYVLRTIYWDLLPSASEWVLKEDVGRSINVFFDFLVIWGGMHGHVAIYKMIPHDDRTHWSPFTAWLYPPFLVGGITRLNAWVRDKFRA